MDAKPLTPEEERGLRYQVSVNPSANYELACAFLTLDAARAERDEARARWREHKTTCCCCQMSAERDSLREQVRVLREADMLNDARLQVIFHHGEAYKVLCGRNTYGEWKKMLDRQVAKHFPERIAATEDKP